MDLEFNTNSSIITIKKKEVRKSLAPKYDLIRIIINNKVKGTEP